MKVMRRLVIALFAVAAVTSGCGAATGHAGSGAGAATAAPVATPSGTPLPSGNADVDMYGY